MNTGVQMLMKFNLILSLVKEKERRKEEERKEEKRRRETRRKRTRTRSKK